MMTKEERVARYLELTAENFPYDTSHVMKEMDVTDEDIEALRQKLERERSMRSTQKRDLVVKQVIKPLLKKHGFSTGGLDWRREIADGYIIIHMMNSQFNSSVTGVCFRFHISTVKKDEIKTKLSEQWIYNQNCELKQFDFLPYCGMLSPYYEGDMYKIDGYKNYLPTDMPVEDICTQFEEDFGEYILPELNTVENYEDFLALRGRKLKRQEEKEIRLLRYYYFAQSGTAATTGGSANAWLAKMREDYGLSMADIESHIDWMDVCRKNSAFPSVDAKAYALLQKPMP